MHRASTTCHADVSGVATNGEIQEVAAPCASYGVPELLEVLRVLAAHPTSAVHRTRPLALRHWIKVRDSLYTRLHFTHHLLF